MTITTSEPFELVTMDFLMVSSFPSRFHYALVFVDHIIKFAVVVSTKDQIRQPQPLPNSFESTWFSRTVAPSAYSWTRAQILSPKFLSGIQKSHTSRLTTLKVMGPVNSSTAPCWEYYGLLNMASKTSGISMWGP